MSNEIAEEARVLVQQLGIEVVDLDRATLVLVNSFQFVRFRLQAEQWSPEAVQNLLHY